MTFTTDFALVSIVWSDRERDLNLSRILGAFYIGKVGGPPLSALIYSRIGYTGTFSFFACACVGTIVILSILLPNYLNDDDEEEEIQIQKT